MKQNKIIPIELSEEDKKLLEQQERDVQLLRDLIIEFSVIPKKYFNSNPDEK